MKTVFASLFLVAVLLSIGCAGPMHVITVAPDGTIYMANNKAKSQIVICQPPYEGELECQWHRLRIARYQRPPAEQVVQAPAVAPEVTPAPTSPVEPATPTDPASSPATSFE